MTDKRDYTRLPDLINGCQRLISGLKEDGDEPKMYEFMLNALQNQPELVLPMFIGSIELARQNLGQDRKSGSSATLFYPIDAAIRVTAKQKNMLPNRDPLSSGNWTEEDFIRVLTLNSNEIVEAAGNLTTCKNLPQRAAQMMWLIDQTEEIPINEKLAFIEIGASKGLILDSLRNPKSFINWMGQSGSSPKTKYGEKLGANKYPGIGVDLAIPSDDWALAMLLNDKSRLEVAQFMKDFPGRSTVVKGNALDFTKLPEIKNFIFANLPSVPFVISCFMLYQLCDTDRQKVVKTSRDFLKENGGGFLLTTDIAKYVGSPDKAGGAVSWIENENGEVVSPQIFCQGDNLCKWEVIKEAE